MDSKHFAIILNLPNKGDILMWTGYYEDHKEEIEKGFVEAKEDAIKGASFYAFLKNNPYKAFVKKQKNNK